MEPRQIRQKWHEAVNAFHSESKQAEHRHWMYEAMDVYQEIPRLIRIHGMERKGELVKLHQQCSHSIPEELKENHLTCCLGIKCKECPELLALESAELQPEEIDIAKAWTCAAHIISKGGDISNEGYILDESDKRYWANLYESLAGQEE